MAIHLPDEIISEILSPVLKVPDDVFSENSRDSPFAQYTESTSALLLVCKAWLRVSTPLLYHVVVLRSKAQTSALERALKRNPVLGRFIKKLRVEGGYGNPMHRIIQAAPNVTDLFLPLSIWSDDNPSGLIQALPLMNPTRIILHDNYKIRANKNSVLLRNVIKGCLKSWRNLTTVELPLWVTYHFNPYASAIATALRDSPNLKSLIIQPIQFYNNVPEYLSLIAQNKSLSSIQLKNPNPDYYPKYAAILTQQSLRGLVIIPTLHDDSPLATPNSPQIFEETQLQFSTAAVPEDIWKRILSFCMVLEFENDKDRKAKPRIQVLLVSKLFAKLGLSYFYETLAFRYTFQFNIFVARLTFPNEHSNFCSQVRTIYINPPKQARLELGRALPEIRLVNLIARTFAPFSVSFQEFKHLAKYSGPTLITIEGIEVAATSTPQSPMVFDQFQCLRKLSVACKAVFDDSVIPSGALPNLEELGLATADKSLVVVLTRMDLPALRSVSFSCAKQLEGGVFFGKHGRKLSTVAISALDVNTMILFDMFILCPSMVDFTVFCGGHNIPDSARFTSSAPHAPLRSITFKGKVAESKWKPFLKSLSVVSFPSLEKIVFPSIKWPTTEHAIGKSAWVKAADRLANHEVRLVDSQDVGWRSRLKK